MTKGTLEAAAQDFVSSLNKVIDAAIGTSVRFIAESKENGERARIEASHSFGRFTAFPLLRPGDDEKAPVLLLTARYTVEMTSDEKHLQVVTSAIGLWVDVTGKRKRHRPLVRLEYNRDPRVAGQPAAHVHLHANSPEMAWLYGSSGQPAPDLHALHFPVGGRRFRPTLEEFLLFLDREKLFTNFKTNWKHEVRRSLREWSDRQAAATVNRHPQIAADVLKQLGYTLSPPSQV